MQITSNTELVLVHWFTNFHITIRALEPPPIGTTPGLENQLFVSPGVYREAENKGGSTTSSDWSLRPISPIWRKNVIIVAPENPALMRLLVLSNQPIFMVTYWLMP